MLVVGETGQRVARAVLVRRGVNNHLVGRLVSDGIGLGIEACLSSLELFVSRGVVRNTVGLVLAALAELLEGSRLHQTNDEAENEEEADNASDHNAGDSSLSQVIACGHSQVHRVVGPNHHRGAPRRVRLAK